MGKQLVLAEKPSVARDYARILNCKTKGEGYIEGADHVVTWSFGHLCTLKEPDDYQPDWKTWRLETLPMIPQFEIKLNHDKGARAQFKVIKQLVHRDDIDTVVIGTDAGREGEAIGRWILLLAENRKPTQRLWVSTMTDTDLRKGFQALKPATHYDSLYDAAYARAKQDWLIGMNFTRLMTLTRSSGKQVLSVGRVQTPVLHLIVQRDLEVDAFHPEPYYEAIATFDKGYKGKWVNEAGESKLADEPMAQQIVDAVLGNHGVVSDVKMEAKSKPAPQLFDLTALQRQMNRRFGFSAKKTLDLAQALYEEHKLLSYPRTNSRYLSQSMRGDIQKIIRRLHFGPFAGFVQPLLSHADLFFNARRYINDEEVTDHHAIIPTDNNLETNYAKLSTDLKRVFDEVALTFLAQFYPDYLYNSTTVYTDVLDHRFLSRGIEETQSGWRLLFSTDPEADQEQSDPEKQTKGKSKSTKGKKGDAGDASDSQKLPPLYAGENTMVIDAQTHSKKTKPPARMTEDSILAMMDKFGLGTPATRAGILETLIQRQFLQRQKKQLISAELGKQFITLVDDRLKSVELTAEMEASLEAIVKQKKTAAEVMEQSVARIIEEMNRLKAEATKLPRSARLQTGSTPVPTPVVDREIVGTCPICGHASIIETDRAFGCARFREGCRFTIWKTMSGGDIPREAAMELLTEGRTSRKLGFVSVKNGRPFEAILRVNREEAKIEFDFQNRST